MAFFEAWTANGPLQYQGKTLVCIAGNTKDAELLLSAHAPEGETLEIRESAHHSFENTDDYMVVGMS